VRAWAACVVSCIPEPYTWLSVGRGACVRAWAGVRAWCAGVCAVARCVPRRPLRCSVVTHKRGPFGPCAWLHDGPAGACRTEPTSSRSLISPVTVSRAHGSFPRMFPDLSAISRVEACPPKRVRRRLERARGATFRPPCIRGSTLRPWRKPSLSPERAFSPAQSPSPPRPLSDTRTLSHRRSAP